MKRLKTYSAKPQEIEPSWQVVDATGQILGRLSSQITKTLQGKDKATYTPHVLTGDYVVVINASKIRVTGRKLTQKVYYRHSGYTGNLKSTILRDLLENHPDRVIKLAVKGMLPATKRGREMLRRLKVYPNESHPHMAQVPDTTNER
jgi:large subunit ribosomal protein L13